MVVAFRGQHSAPLDSEEVLQECSTNGRRRSHNLVLKVWYSTMFSSNFAMICFSFRLGYALSIDCWSGGPAKRAPGISALRSKSAVKVCNDTENSLHPRLGLYCFVAPVVIPRVEFSIC